MADHDGCDPAADPIFRASLDLVPRTGAKHLQIRYSDDEDPTVWMAVAGYEREPGLVHEVGAALTPGRAVFRLLERLMDGGQCQHCRRPSGISDDFTGRMPMDVAVCWYRFDPELTKFRRACEGTDTRPCNRCGVPEVVHLSLQIEHAYAPDRRIR